MLPTPEILTAIALWCEEVPPDKFINQCRDTLVQCVQTKYTEKEIVECFKKCKYNSESMDE